jgi:hypothetical protein
MEKQEFNSFIKKSIGSKVEIINKSGINKGMYSSSLLDSKDNVFGVAQPIYKGSWVQMSGMELILNIKSNDFLVEVPVISRGTTFEGPVPILWVEAIGEANKVQRRSFVRIPCIFEASCCFLEIYSDIFEDEPAEDVSKEWVTILINNISLGGISAKVKPGYISNFCKKGRYLLAINLGGGLMFLNLLLRNILIDSDDNMPNGAFAFGGLSVFQERAIGNYVRRQELAGK